MNDVPCIFMRPLEILLYTASALLLVGIVWLVGGEIRDTRRFLNSERHFYFNLHTGQNYLRCNIRALEGCTPQQADAVYDSLVRERWIEYTDEMCHNARLHLDTMTMYCPHRYIGRLALRIREYEHLNALIWWTQLPTCYRATPLGFALVTLPMRGEPEAIR